MTISAGTVFINVAANIGPFRTQMLGLGSTISKVGSNISRVGTGISRAITVPLGFAALAATKLALDYDAAFTRISALSNASAKDVEKWKDQVLDLAGKTARAPEELANALYFLASAGLKTNQVMPALREAAKGAAIGMGETKDVASLLASVLNAYSKSGITAADVTDTLAAAIKAGRAEPEEFANAMGRILPIASKAKVEFDNVAASLAVVSNIGLDVNEGVTAMRGILNSLTATGPQAAETLKKIGFSAIELRDILAEKGLLGTVRILEEEARERFGKGWLDALDEIIPNIRALTGAMALTTQEAERVDDIFAQVAHSTGEADKAFEKTAKGPMFQFQQALAKLKATAIEIGRDLIPILLDVANAISDWISAFRGLDDDTQQRIIKIGLALIALGPVVRIIGGLTTAFSGLLVVFRGIVGIGSKVVGAITGATAAAKGAQQLTLFGGGAAAAGGGFGAAITAGALAAAAAVGYLVIKIHDSHEEVDGLVQDMQQGKFGLDRLRESSDNARITIDGLTTSTKNTGLAARAAAPAFNAARTQIEQNQEATERIITTYREMAMSFGLNFVAAQNLAVVFAEAGNTTERFRHRVAALLGGYEKLGIKVRDLTLKQFQNLLMVGDIDGAYRVLRQGLEETGRRWDKNREAISKNIVEQNRIDVAQRIAARSGRDLKDVLKDMAPAAKDAGDKIKETSDKAKDLGKQKPKITIEADGSQPQRVLQGLRSQLETLVGKEWNVNVNVTTTGGSTGFHLLQMLEKRLEEITEKPWKTTVEVVAEDSTIRAITGFAADATRGLEKIKTVTEQVFGEDFPKAYQDDLKAFKEASSEKIKTFTKDLKLAEKAFDKLKNKVNSFKDAIRGAFADASTLIGGALEELAKTTTLVGAGPEGEDIEVATPGDISSFLQNQIAEAKSFALKLAQLASSGLAPALLAELAGQGTAALPLVDALLAGGKDLIKEFNEANLTIKKFAETTANALGEEYFGGALKKARNGLEGLSNRIDRFTERIAGQIEQFVNALQTRRLGNEIESLIQALNRSLRQLGVSVPHAAAGGIVRKPTLLVAGEAGPEAIIPLDKSGAMGGDVNVYVDVRGNAIYARDLAEEVRSILLRDKRHKGALGLA